MTFTEPAFWALTVITFVLWLLFRRTYRGTLVLLLVASLVFYGYHQWQLLPLLLTYCFVDWFVACWLVRSRWPWHVLGLGVAFNLVVLGYWKYMPLLLRTAAKALLALDLPECATPHDWVIPFGISFYAFTGIAYLVDVYRRDTPVETNFFRYTVSAIFFPHLVAGPILRPGDFLEKLRQGCMPDRPEAPLEATWLLARGLFKKMVLADRISLAIDPFFAHVADASTAGVWSLPYVYLYALQIYLDFSGYTDIARGLGLAFGFRWPDNFALPYLAGSVQEFWRRWHITLSLFLRDYLYIPLGGSQKGRGWMIVCLLVTMLLGGLWHGASWSFLLWGGLHGTYLVVYHLWKGTSLCAWLAERTGLVAWLWRGACIALTFHLVCLAWCFFRLTVLTESLICVQKWFVFDADKLLVGGANDLSLWLLLGLYAMFIWAASRVQGVPAFLGGQAETAATPLGRGFLWGFGVGLLLLALLLSPGGESAPFIYFQF